MCIVGRVFGCSLLGYERYVNILGGKYNYSGVKIVDGGGGKGYERYAFQWS